MKILSLDFKNINSLKGEHHIDFTADEFARNPLFAITGPTGSGKTTLLDVISLALFGEVPRLGKISKTIVDEKGAILTRNQEEAFAKVTYSCKHGQFASVWEISTTRTGNLRDYEMELTQLNPLRRLSHKKSEIPSKNEELIGLRYSQFIKSVVLAQGEFSKFLKAPKKERSELLEQITGTGIYRVLGIRAFRKYADRNKEIEQEEQLLMADREAILPEEEKAEKVRELKALKKAIEGLNKKKEEALEQLRFRKELREQQRALEKKEGELRTQQVRQKAFEETYGERIKKHEQIEEFSVAIQDWTHQEKLLEELKKEETQLLVRKKDFEERKNVQLQKIQKFIQNPVEEKALISALDAFYNRVNALQEQMKAIGEQYRSGRRAFEREIEGLELQGDSTFLVTHPEQWEQVTVQFKKRKNELEAYFNGVVPRDFDRQIDLYKNRMQLIKEAQKEQRFIKDWQETLKKDENRLHTIREKGKELPGIIKHLKHQVEQADKEVENLDLRYQNQLMAAKVEDLRRRLEDGKPCLVCGSTTHPYAHHTPQKEKELKAKIRIAKTALHQYQKNLTQKRTEERHWKEQELERAENLRLERTKLKARKLAFNKEYNTVADLREQNWEKKIKTVEEEIENLQRYRKIREEQEQVERAQPVFNELLSIFKRGRQIKEELQQYYQGKNLLEDYQRLQSDWLKGNQDLKFINLRLKEHREKLKQEKAAFKKQVRELLPKLENRGYSSVKAAQEVVLPNTEYKKMRDSRLALEKRIAELISSIRTEENRKKKLEEQLQSGQLIKELEETIQEMKGRITEQTTTREELDRCLKNDDELLKRIERRKKDINMRQKENFRWKLLSRLIGDSKGDRFNQFAQDLTLRHLLALANRRLQHISGRYRLIIKPNTDKNTDNLVVSDLDMGSQERAVQTLSGGETFLMSLALALALSDLASKNVQINSLFIDEGFGTLDPETLDQTLDTLERLQAASNKTIGIISHVESLKERIATQIQLERNGQGYSSLKIVSG